MPVITKPNQHFDATLYTGTGAATQTATNSGSMQPDFVWIKDRSQSTRHVLTDSVRGVGKSLYSSTTDSEGTDDSTGYLSAFNSNGFTLNRGSGGLGERVNYTSDNYVAWQWKAGGAAVANTSGSISSQVSVNSTAGFSIVTYTGTGANATVGHGLGVVPSLYVVKRRNNVDGWFVYSNQLAATQYLRLNTTAAAATFNFWQDTAPTSSVFSISTDVSVNANSDTYVAYCFAQVAGYSAFGSYTGNGSTDGPFVFLGFRPRFVITKRTDSSSGGNWTIIDSARNPYNVTNQRLFADTSDADGTGNIVHDFVSNGFKVRQGDSSTNNISGATYIYMAFAEAPFKFSNAR